MVICSLNPTNVARTRAPAILCSRLAFVGGCCVWLRYTTTYRAARPHEAVSLSLQYRCGISTPIGSSVTTIAERGTFDATYAAADPSALSFFETKRCTYVTAFATSS